MRNIFFKKSYTNEVETYFPDPSVKNKKWAYLWINSIKFYADCFFVCQVEDYQNTLILSCTPLPFTSYKAFLENKMRSETSLTASFSAWVLNKNISLVIFYYLTRFHCLHVFSSCDIGQCVYCNKFWK